MCSAPINGQIWKKKDGETALWKENEQSITEIYKAKNQKKKKKTSVCFESQSALYSGLAKIHKSVG